MERLTKIVATLGPAVADQARIDELVESGMDVARLNFSHGDYDLHRSFTTWVRTAAENQNRVVAVLQDIQGPKLRVGSFPGGSVNLENDQVVLLVPGRLESEDPNVIYVDYEFLLEDVEPGERILLADGLIRLVAEEHLGDRLSARVEQGGELKDGKGVAFPETNLRVPAITEKDRRDLEFGRELDVDYIAASFVRSGQDIREIRELAGGVPVIAKIELAAAYDNLDDILSEAAGAMVARGDLGVQLPLERIPLIQADILERTNAAGLISITATEMLESMTSSPRPTRAEVADVANAVLDGTDAVMLSAETAVGKFPARAVEVMDIVCREVEAGMDFAMHGVEFLRKENAFPSAVAKACVEAADSLDLPAIIAFSESGSTARLISKYRPKARIIGFTAIPKTRRQMALYWGVTPLDIMRFDSTDEMIEDSSTAALERGILRPGDGVAIVAGIPPNQAASTNLLKLHQVGTGGGGTPKR